MFRMVQMPIHFPLHSTHFSLLSTHYSLLSPLSTLHISHYTLLSTLYTLPSSQQLLYRVKLVEGLHWGEIIDVEIEELIANLRQHWIVELEERELGT